MRKRIAYIIGVIFLLQGLFYSPGSVEASKLPSGSKVAAISVEELTDDELKQKLAEEIKKWQSGSPILLKSDHEQFLIPRSVAKFDIDATVDQLKEQTKRQWRNLFLKRKDVHISINVQIDESMSEIQKITESNYLDAEKTLLNLTEIFSQLSEEEVTLHYVEGAEIERDTIAETTIKNPDKQLSEAVLLYAVDELDGQIIYSHDSFSLLDSIEFPNKLTDSGAELSYLASTLYSLILQTNFEIVKRESTNSTTNYLQTGLNILVDPTKDKDFIVYNPNDFSFQINVEKQAKELMMSLHSTALDYTYDYEIKDQEEITERTLYRYSKELQPGESKVVEEGKSGLTAKVYRNSFDSSGHVVDSELINHEFILPKPRIILVSTEEEIASDELAEEEETSPEDGSYEDLLDLFRTEEFNDLISFEEAMDELERELLEAELEYGWMELVAEEQLKEINDQTEEHIQTIKVALKNTPEFDKVEFDNHIKQLLSVAELLENNKTEQAEEEIKTLTKDYEQMLQNLDQSHVKKFLQSLLDDNEGGD